MKKVNAVTVRTTAVAHVRPAAKILDGTLVYFLPQSAYLFRATDRIVYLRNFRGIRN